MVDLAVGVTCNNCCIMCTSIMPPPRGGWDRSRGELEQIIKKFSKDSDKVVITGGEATIRPDFFHILRLIKNQMPDSKILLLTNGRMLCYPEFTRKFVATCCDSVAIPLHGHNARLHDKITRSPGSFKQTVQGIKNLLRYRDKIDIEIRVVIHKLNYRYLPAIASFISKEFKGIRRVVLFPIDLVGNANINRKGLLIKITDAEPFIEKGVSILEKRGFEAVLFHIPFCVIDKKYWKNIAGRTVEERRITFEPCAACIMKEKCPGIWRTYASRVGTKEFKPISKYFTKSNI